MTVTRAVAATVTGRVQGVWFRSSTERRGQELGLVGWVRNEPDGSVKTWAQGPEDALNRFVVYLEQGPPAARVASVDVQDVTPDTTLAGFRVI